MPRRARGLELIWTAPATIPRTTAARSEVSDGAPSSRSCGPRAPCGIRLAIPALSEERRKQLVKQVKKTAEELTRVAIEGIDRAGEGYRVRMRRSTDGRELSYDADAVIATTGFSVPLGDLPELGVATFAQGKMPAITRTRCFSIFPSCW